MKYPIMTAFAAALFVTSATTPLMAQTPQAPMQYEVMQNHPSDSPAQMRIIANSKLTDVHVRITGCAQEVIQKHFKKIDIGKIKNISWKQPAGIYQCKIEISGKDAKNRPWTAQNDHQFSSFNQIQLNVNLRELVPEMNEVILHASHPFSTARIAVTAEDGSTIDSVEKKIDKLKDCRLTWTPNDKKPALLDIRIEDEMGSWAASTIFYFQIPHTDIVFDTAKTDIRKDQDKYLLETLEKIQAVLKTHHRVAVNLYITGHTDTVGSASSNIRLSLNRAKSIAAWFKKHGLNIPVYYRGAGERALAENTPDNTPNENNRRAVYILSNQPPMEPVDLGPYKKLK